LLTNEDHFVFDAAIFVTHIAVTGHGHKNYMLRTDPPSNEQVTREIEYALKRVAAVVV
jgi:hypothetical protein